MKIFRVGDHNMLLGEVGRSSLSFVNLSCTWVGLALVPNIGFGFIGLAFFPSAQSLKELY